MSKHQLFEWSQTFSTSRTISETQICQSILIMVRFESSQALNVNWFGSHMTYRWWCTKTSVKWYFKHFWNKVSSNRNVISQKDFLYHKKRPQLFIIRLANLWKCYFVVRKITTEWGQGLNPAAVVFATKKKRKKEICRTANCNFTCSWNYNI